MVLFKINAESDNEHEVRITSEEGTWHNGGYHLFSATAITQQSDEKLEQPQNLQGSNFLGELIVDKEKGYWEYKGDKLPVTEQKQVADFIMDYQAPDGVY